MDYYNCENSERGQCGRCRNCVGRDNRRAAEAYQNRSPLEKASSALIEYQAKLHNAQRRVREAEEQLARLQADAEDLQNKVKAAQTVVRDLL